ncbi:uncharacterized protein LOC130810723 [Amaranthus tricolor]|uniref:uncharacterized protein LOC130810723 n=1 Tax=Amaranthus tricolor TaxID=29722 RepID=UPI00258D81E6|nr:uncharacterized protein LOC130810723 [Amaranthus tricolor]
MESSSPSQEQTPTQISTPSQIPTTLERLSESDILTLEHDPGLRRRISDFHVDDRELIRCEYIRRGPCQPKNKDFPYTYFGKKCGSKTKNVAYCFACYLFKNDNVYCAGDAVVRGGFNTWGKVDSFEKHFGGHMSTHNNAL